MPLLLTITLLAAAPTQACTFFKITQGERTMVGNNEDAWGLEPWIHFVPGRDGRHGVAYVGHRDGLPQGGMNDAGLVFDGLTVPAKAMHAQTARSPVPGTFPFLERILGECASIADVQHLLGRYDWTSMSQAMIVFVDRAGNYLVMEGDTVIIGNEASYVAGNFRPSQCTDLDSVSIPRFQQGRAYLAAHGDTSLRSCVGMMEAMKACRKKFGEGTLYTSIYDLQQGLVHLCFYHDFAHLRTFDLQAELAKGDHTVMMTALFSPNAEYQRLARYHTPFNTSWMRWGLLACALYAAIMGLYALIGVFRVLRNWKTRRAQLLNTLLLGVASMIAVVLV
ncbi:MAG TPA: hypothetical protein VHL57_01500, partial [Flavobacteriales bacterium]|nr:hypothetical protein [Flavobacteriales bacterium]